MKDSVLILSGGMDSTTLLYDQQERIALAVTFDYGANHNSKEIPFAQLHCQRLGIEHLVIPLAFIGQYFDSSLLSGSDAIPEGSYKDSNMRSTVVPFRNGIMLSIAVGLAESRRLKYVMMANHGGDHAIYPDCRSEFVAAFSEAARTGTYPGITLQCPYTNMSKGQIAARGKDLGIDYSETWSCYKGGDKPCGRCGTCVERREALAEAGIEDTTIYD
jgi:7-cyano-7-deazaguanine synthase